MNTDFDNLVKATGCTFHLEFNPHKINYETVKKYLDSLNLGGDDDFYDVVGELDYDKDLWTLQVYPRTPVGFIAGCSNDLEALLKWGAEGAKDY